MYFIRGYIFILLNAYPLSWSKSTFYNKDRTKALSQHLLLATKHPMFIKRMLYLMENYVDRAKVKIDDVLYIRSKYEVSGHFEFGYVLSELVERYRKMVGTVRRPLAFKSDAVFDTIKRTELVQKLFFDVLHLVYMANEIPQKYRNMFDVEGGRVDINISMAAIEEQRKYRLWAKKKHQKEMRKERELFSRGEQRLRPKKIKRPNKWWPIDYGWEIDYHW